MLLTARYWVSVRADPPPDATRLHPLKLTHFTRSSASTALLSTALAGNSRATSPSKVLGRIWCDIAHILDEDVSSLVLSGKLVWLPAHCARTNVGQSKLSNGQRMTAIDWRANRLVDQLAKNAAAFNALTKPAADMINSTAKLAKHYFAQLAQVTHAANNHSVVRVDENGNATTHTVRDSMHRPRFAKKTASRKRCLPPQPPRDISGIAPWQPPPVLDDQARKAKVRRTATVQRSKANDLHVRQNLCRLASNNLVATTHAESDAKRARLLDTVRKREAAAAE